MTTLPERLAQHARERPHAVALRHKSLGIWNETTWAEYAAVTAAAALGLARLGVGAGDVVAIHSENRPEWVIADLAAQALGAISVGLYPTNPPAEVEYLLADSTSKVLVAEDQEQLDKTLEVRERLPGLEHIVVVDTRGLRGYDESIIGWDDLLALGRADDDESSWESSWETFWDGRAPGPGGGDVATLVYTSGTTGPPKGVMLTHDNIDASIHHAAEVFDTTSRDQVLSYLPLCHVAEKIFTLWQALGAGYCVNFAESLDTVPDNLREVQPTLFLGVPRVWERMHAGVQIRMHDSSRLKRALYARAFKLPRSLASLVAFGALRRRLGMNRCRLALSGAAPIAPEVLAYFADIGVPMFEAYGMSESAGLGTINLPGDTRLGSVGKAVPGIEVSSAPDGELLMRGDSIFAGYWKRPDATAETVDADAWLHTGDVGRVDADGFWFITDRKKDIIITAGGKNISPAEIENKLKVSPFVREAVVIGDRRKFLSALVGIEADTVGNWAERQGIAHTTYADLCAKPEVVALVAAEVERVNSELARVESIREFRLIPKELDHEDGELTATQKVKRSAIAQQFAPLIGDIYGEANDPTSEEAGT